MPLLYRLNKSDAVRTVQKVPYRLLEAVPELGEGDTNTENMLIQGDNLQALKALLPLYAGKGEMYCYRSALQYPFGIQSLRRQPGAFFMVEPDVSTLGAAQGVINGRW